MAIIKQEERIVADFVVNTSAHGFRSHYYSRLSWRLIWFVVILAAWTYCVYETAILVQNYLRYETTQSIKVTTSTYNPFPAVTVCNQNPYRNSSLNELIALNDTYIIPGLRYLDYFNTYSSLTGYSAVDRAYWKNLALTGLRGDLFAWNQYMASESLENISHSIDTMLIDCFYQNSTCSAANFTSWDHAIYGRCHTMLVTSEEETAIGIVNGLTLRLNSERSEYVPVLVESIGFQVLVHSPYYVPFPEDTGFSISVGEMVDVGLRQRQIFRLPYPYNDENCGVIGGAPDIDLSPYESYNQTMINSSVVLNSINYTTAMCIKACYVLQVYDQLNCTDANYMTYTMAVPFFAEMNETLARSCNIDDFGYILNISLHNCSQSCVQPCNEISYDAQIKANAWPQIDSADYGQLSQLVNNEHMIPDDPTKLFTRLNVYFQDLQYQAIVESASMQLFDLLSSIGGVLALFVGASVLTFIEIFQTVFAIVGCSQAKARVVTNTNDSNKVTCEHHCTQACNNANDQTKKINDIPLAFSHISVKNNYGLANDYYNH